MPPTGNVVAVASVAAVSAAVASAAGDYQSAVSAFLDLCLCFGLVVVEVGVVVGC